MKIVVTARPRRTLDFDIENRPLSYLGSDFTTDEITAIACCWTDDPSSMECWTLTKRQSSLKRMLLSFVARYDEADVVTGHYIRKHDLPKINGMLMELELPPLGAKLTSDTKLDLVRRSGISASQENLAEMYGLSAGKYHMSQVKWREANRLTPEGIELTRKRVMDDVLQHMELRARLIERGALGPPKEWRP